MNRAVVYDVPPGPQAEAVREAAEAASVPVVSFWEILAVGDDYRG